MKASRDLLLVISLACIASTALSFSPHLTKSRTSGSDFKTALHVATLPKDDGSGLSYGERSRPYRRDLFNEAAWVKHRSTDRFIGNLIDIFKSGVVRQLQKEVTLITSVAAFICLYNALMGAGYQDFSGVQHDPILSGFPVFKIPAQVFTLSSPSLSLLLVFKTNTSYQRWDEARKAWGLIVNSSRSIMRQGAAWLHESDLPMDEKRRLMARLAAAVWSFPRSLTRHLLSEREDEEAFREDVRANLRPDLAEDLIAVRHRPTRAMYELSCAINEFPLSDFRRVSMDTSANVLCDAMGGSERIFTSPVPRSYTRHTARFLEIWLLMMPLALYEPFAFTWNHWALVPATVIISFFLLGIEELGIQLEEPFSILPLHKITNNIGLNAEEHVQWFLKDEERMQTNGGFYLNRAGQQSIRVNDHNQMRG